MKKVKMYGTIQIDPTDGGYYLSGSGMRPCLRKTERLALKKTTFPKAAIVFSVMVDPKIAKVNEKI